MTDTASTPKTTIESRTKWEPLEPIPNGWEFVRHHFDSHDNTMDMLIRLPDTDHTTWIEMRKVYQHRTVTEWSDRA